MTQRHFSFSDGKSDKFWQISVEGDTHSVQYGKTGTTGQTQTKSFASDDEAQKAADKLIAEKVKKGYVESGNGAAPTVAAPKTTPKAEAKTAAKKSAPEAEEMAAQEVESAPATPAATTFTASAPRQLRLEAHDWLWATWRPREIQTRPVADAKPFDKDEALARLAKVPGKFGYSNWEWSKAKIAPMVSREEAHFWFAAMTSPVAYDWTGHQAKIQNEFLPGLKAREYDGNLSAAGVIDLFKRVNGSNLRQINPLIMRFLGQLMAPLELLETVLATDQNARSKDKRQHQGLEAARSITDGFREHVLPFVSNEEVEAMRALLRPEIKVSGWPSDYYGVPKIAFYLGAQLGLSAELSDVVKGWKDDFYTAGDNSDWHDHYHRPQEIVFGLGSAAEVEAQMRRLKLRVSKPQYVRAWLAHTEFSAPDVIVSSILDARGENYNSSAKDAAEKLTQTFALAQAPEIAPAMLQLLLESKAPRAARQWLEDNPAHTISGLLPVAAGRGKFAEAAVEQLRSLKKRGAESALREAARSLSAEEQARLESSVLGWSEKHFEPFSDADTPEVIRAALQIDSKLKPLKSWILGTDLPPITFGDRRLSDAQVELLLSALRCEKHPLSVAVKQSADRASLDAFAWKLFERWLGESAPSKEKWAMLALGELGGDACALKLTPLVREWPGQAQHGRAVTGLECLRAIGTDTALMQINGIAQKVKFKGLQGKAVEAMEGIAADRGFSRAQLEDRVVPTLDLDETGTRIFDFGPRQFKMVLSPEMKPLVREVGAEMSKPKPDLPKPTAKDDAAKADAALAEWKLLKKQLSEAVKIQAVRLENAMVRGRRWTPDEFEVLLAKHPLMSNLVRLLVWEAASGNRRATFRVTEDGTYADQNDEPFDLSVGEWAHIGIAHPLHLSEAERGAWGEVFSDYEIVPPFAQLGRAIYSLEGDEAGGKTITRFKNIAVPPETLNFGLEKLDWKVGGLHDHGDYYQHSKVFEAAGVTAWVSYEPGLFKGYREGWEPQKMVRCFFLPSDYEHKTYYDADEKQALPLLEIDAVAVSEVLKDLSGIAAKGEEKV
ncbi:MAG TPA: DUF4132 domain-containing protein [Abditibacterium sp.]|jgi:predicted DNA-binding WGR domain protein